MKTTYLYEVQDFESAQSLQPQAHKIGGLFGGYSHVSIFPVSQDNSVGSNDMGNAITLISFPKGKIDYEKHFRNADDIIGSGKYLPVISPDLIGFGQVRVFHLFDFKKKLYRKYRIVFPVSKYIENIAIADARTRHFIFEIESQKAKPKDAWDVDYILQLVDLSSDKPVLIKEFKEEPGTTWTTTKDRVFLWAFEDKKLRVLDMNLEPAHHPLEDAVKQYKDKIDFSRIYIHPSLPFAVLTGGEKGATFINWKEENKNIPHLLSSRSTQCNFSADGNWLVLNKKISSNEIKTYLIDRKS